MPTTVGKNWETLLTTKTGTKAQDTDPMIKEHGKLGCQREHDGWRSEAIKNSVIYSYVLIHPFPLHPPKDEFCLALFSRRLLMLSQKRFFIFAISIYYIYLFICAWGTRKFSNVLYNFRRVSIQEKMTWNQLFDISFLWLHSKLTINSQITLSTPSQINNN